MILAGKALRDTSESYRNRLSIRLFCLECVDRVAGQYALDHHPETLDRARDFIIQYFRSCHPKHWQTSEANLARELSNKEQRIAECQSSIKKSPVCDSTKKQSSARSQPSIKKSPVCDSTKKQSSARSQPSIKKSPVCDSTKKQNSARSQPSIKKSPVCDFRKEQNITPNQPSFNKSTVCDPPNSTESANTANKKQKTFTQNRPSKKSKKAKVKKTRAKRTLSTDEHPSELLAVDKSLQKTVESRPQKEEIASSSRLDDCILQESKEQKTGSADSPLKATWKDSIYLNCPSRVGEYRMISTTAQISEEHSNSCLMVDELNGSQTNSISGEPVTTTDVLNDDIEEEAILKTEGDQKRHRDEDLSVVLEIYSICLVNGNTKGDKIISHVVDSEMHNQEKVKEDEILPSENSPIKEEIVEENLLSENSPIKEDRKEENLLLENFQIKEDRKENFPSENFLIKEERKEENLPSENFPIKEDRKEENLPSENSPIKEDRKEENLPSENSPVKEEIKEDSGRARRASKGGAPCPHFENGKSTLPFWNSKAAPCPF